MYDTRIQTGNRLLNVLLTEKSLYCQQKGITLSCMADGSKLSFIEDGDLYCLFGNIIDNALEAVNCIEQRESRVINIVVKSKNDMLVIQEENYFNGNLNFKDGLPVTTKSDKNYHGFGMSSIRMITRKYEGELSISQNANIFHLNIVMPIQIK
jgi:sensor histidine kinase regulating citrate/malate metabolism